MNDRFLRACRGERTAPLPVWLMRQAGRYLPEYREIRARTTFLELCRTPELAAQVTVQPVEIIGVDAAIVFADILLPLDAMGAGLAFTPGDGPRFDRPVRGRSDIDTLTRPDVDKTLGYVFETLRVTRSALAGRVPLIGFAGSPWTLSAYLVEGGVSTSFPRLLAWSYSDPDGLRALLDLLADVTIDYLLGQIDAGAQAVQIFDTWGGLLSAERWRALVLPATVRVLEAVPSEIPTIFFLRGGAHLLDVLAELPADVLSVDWRVPLDEVRRRTGSKTLQGNLDPCALFAAPERLREETARLIEAGRGGGHVVNLGHGILPTTPVAGARAFVRAVHDLSA